MQFRSCIRLMLFTLLLLMAMPGFTPDMQAQTFSVIHNFTGGADGEYPSAGVTMDAGGRLYGTAFGGGGFAHGSVFRLAHLGSGWIVTSLYAFQGYGDGAYPNSRVVFGPDGSLYGTAASGGTGNCDGAGCGAVFNLRPPFTVCKTVVCPWSENVLSGFTGQNGAYPYADVVFDQAGNLYSTTVNGGTGDCSPGEMAGCGLVFQLTHSGVSWTENVLYDFSGGDDGGASLTNVIFDASGNLYGTTTRRGVDNGGTVFQLIRSGSDWTYNLLHSFQCQGDEGCFPFGGLLLDQAGNLYGTTSIGGAGGAGTVFVLTPSQGSWTSTVLYSFTGGYQAGPRASLTADAAGDLYGTVYADGPSRYGSIFKLTRVGASWTYSNLHNFTGGSDGGNPISTVLLDTSGHLYGTASKGGNWPTCNPSGGCGVVWEISP
jgi:uncharacterized repeat protein (TIGR03803 family)